MPRPIATGIVSGGALVLGGFAAWFWGQPVPVLSDIVLFDGQDTFSILDTLTSRILMPVGAILTSLFVGWVASRRLIDSENGLSGGLHHFWLFLVRWACPLALIVILIVGIFPSIIGE